MGLFGSILGSPDAAGYLLNVGQPQQPQNMFQMAAQPTAQQSNPSISGPMAQLPTDPRIAKAMQPGFFGKGGRGWGILGVIGDGLQVAGGGRATYQDYLRQQDEYAQRLKELQDERKARMAERMTPHAEQVGNTIGMLDPATGAFTPTYTAPQQEQVPEVVRRITAAGIDPNSEEGRRLIVGSITNSPDAIAAQTALADHRFNNSMALKQTAPARGGVGGGIHGRTKSNPIPVNSKEALLAVPPGTWVSLPNGTVTQRR